MSNKRIGPGVDTLLNFSTIKHISCYECSLYSIYISLQLFLCVNFAYFDAKTLNVSVERENHFSQKTTNWTMSNAKHWTITIFAWNVRHILQKTHTIFVLNTTLWLSNVYSGGTRVFRIFRTIDDFSFGHTLSHTQFSARSHTIYVYTI